MKVKDMYLTLDQVKALWEDYNIMDVYYDYDHRNFVDLMLYRSALHLYKHYLHMYDVQGIVLTRKICKQIEHDYNQFVTRQFQLHPEFEYIITPDFAAGLTIAVMLESNENEVSTKFKDYIQCLSLDEQYHDKAYSRASNNVMNRARKYALKHLEDLKNETRGVETDNMD